MSLLKFALDILLLRAFSTMAMQMEWIQTILLLGGSLLDTMFDHDKNCDGDDDDDHQHHCVEDPCKDIDLSVQSNYQFSPTPVRVTLSVFENCCRLISSSYIHFNPFTLPLLLCFFANLIINFSNHQSMLLLKSQCSIQLILEDDADC